jgi:hypothetical protein
MGRNRVSPLEMGIEGGEGVAEIARIAKIARHRKTQISPRRRGEELRLGGRISGFGGQIESPQIAFTT